MDMDMDAEPSATGRVATPTRAERKKAAVWTVHDPRAVDSRISGGGGGGVELSF